MSEKELLQKASQGNFSIVDALSERIHAGVIRRLGKKDTASKICSRSAVVDYLDKVKKNKAPIFENYKELQLHLVHKALKIYYQKAEAIILDKKLMNALLNNDGWAYYYMQVKFFPSITAMVLANGGTEEDAKDVIMDGV